MKTKLQDSNMNSQVSAANLAPPKTRDSHRQLGMQTNQWTAKGTFSVSRVFFACAFISSVSADMATSKP